MPELAAKRRPRHRDHERRHAAGRRRQGGRRRGDGRGRVPRRAPGAAAADDPGRLHARRGGRAGRELFDLERFGARLRLHARRLRGGRVHDETFTAASADVRSGASTSIPGFATGKLVNATRLAGEILAKLPPDSPGGDRRPRGVHPRLLGRGLGRRGDDPRDRARLRRRPARRHVALLRTVAEDVVATEPRADSRSRSSRSTRTCAVPRRAAGGRRRGRGGAPARGVRAAPRRRSAAARTARSSARAGSRRRTCSPAGTSSTRVREWASAQDMASAAAVAVRLAGVWAERGLSRGALGELSRRPASCGRCATANVRPAGSAPGWDGRVLCRPRGSAAPGVRLPAPDARARRGARRAACRARRRGGLRARPGAGGGAPDAGRR